MWFASQAGSHACHFYESAREQKAVVLPFVQEGLARGEQCVCVADEQPVDAWHREFETCGIDVAQEVAMRRLIVCAGERWRGDNGFHSLANARQAWNMIEDGLARFRGIRFAVDAGWMLEAAVPPDRLCHWEATINPLIAGGPEVRILCQYNLTRHPPAAVHSALRTHTTAIIGGRCLANPHFEGGWILEREPDLNHSTADAGQLEGMLMSLSQQPTLRLDDQMRLDGANRGLRL